MAGNKANVQIDDTVLKDWQEIVNILSEIAVIPAALIMRRDCEQIEVFVASENSDNPYTPGTKEYFKDSGLYCERVIKTQQKLLVANALKDPEWDHNPDIKLNMISYLGLPIKLPDNQPFGTICILDNKENKYTEAIEKLLGKFRDLIEFQLQLITLNQSMGEKNKQLSDYIQEFQAFKGLIPICARCKNIKENDNTWSPIEKYLFQHPEVDFTHTICPECFKILYPDLQIDS